MDSEIPSLSLTEFLESPEPCYVQVLGSIEIVQNNAVVSLDFGQNSVLRVYLTHLEAKSILLKKGEAYFMEKMKRTAFPAFKKEVEHVLGKEIPEVEFEAVWETAPSSVILGH